MQQLKDNHEEELSKNKGEKLLVDLIDTDKDFVDKLYELPNEDNQILAINLLMRLFKEILEAVPELQKYQKLY